jgi:hypothetical protein
VASPIGCFRYRTDSKSGRDIGAYYAEMARVLGRYDSGVFASLLQKRYFPELVKRLAPYLHPPRYAGKVLSWDKIVDRYLVRDERVAFKNTVRG